MGNVIKVAHEFAEKRVSRWKNLVTVLADIEFPLGLTPTANLK